MARLREYRLDLFVGSDPEPMATESFTARDGLEDRYDQAFVAAEGILARRATGSDWYGVLSVAGEGLRCEFLDVVELTAPMVERCAGAYPLCTVPSCVEYGHGIPAAMTSAGGARIWCPRCGRESYRPDEPGCPNTPVDTVPTLSGPVAVCVGHRQPGVQLWRS